MKSYRYIYLFLTACVCFSMKSLAQGICSSNALAPVFKQTFDSSKTSGTKSGVPTGFVTNYTLQTKKALSDGEYMVTPLVQNSQKADWAVGGDHTGNTNGNMFLVNAGTGASQFFYQQVDNLCPGSVYSFSAWLVNVNTITQTKPICGSGYVYPKVTFKIKNTSGTVLQSFTTDTLPLTKSTTSSPNWQQYGFQFTLPSGTTSLILEMVDFYGGQPQCGNDLAIDDIVFSACTPTATATLSGSSTICAGSSASISSSIVNSPYSNPAYQWQKSTDGGTTWTSVGTAGTGSTSYSIASSTITDGGMYRVLVGPDVSSLTSSTCVTASNTISLTVNPSPTISINAVSSACSGNTLSLGTTASGGTTPYSYSWTGPNSFSSTAANPSITNVTTAATGTYTVTLTDNKSCTATATKPVTVSNTPTVAAIAGNAGGCTGSTVTLTDATPGGIWSSDNTAVATVTAGGVVTLVSGGTANISYTVTNGSCSASVTKTITAAGVSLHPDVIECNNGITHFTASDTYYGVTYSNSNIGNTYVWSISGGTYSYQGSSNANSQYPSLQLLTGSTFTVNIQFTTGGVTCSATQIVYKNTVAADTIQGSHDTTVCYNTSPISLSGKVSPVTNVYSWTSSGTGVFSAPGSLNTTYTPSAADKVAGIVSIYLSGSSTLNSTGNCGTATSIDSMILRIYPDNTGTNTTQIICSNKALNFTPNSAIPGSTFSWISAVISGTATGNTGSGTGNIIDSLVNLSNTTDAVIRYTITPYAFTPSNNSCNGTAFTFTVTAHPKPAITITNNTASICTGNAINIQFNSSLSGSMYTWSSSVIAGSTSGNSSNAVASAANIISDVLINNSGSNNIVRYRITATSPYGCSQTDSTDVLVYGSPATANAGPDQTLCNVNSALLAANTPALGNGNWTMLSGPSSAIFVSASSPTSTVNGLVAGIYQFVWTVSNGSCAVSKDTVKIVNAPLSVAGMISSDATVCAGINSGTLTLSGYTGNILRWESSGDGGASWPTIINNTSNTYSYSNLTASTLYRAIVQSGTCSYANTNPVTITVNPASVPGVLSSDTTVCAASNSGTMILSGYTGSIIRWESSTDGGASWPTTISNTTYTYHYTNLTTTTLFRAIVQSGGCNATSSNAITVTVTPQTVPGTLSANATVCATANNGTISITGYTGTIMRWESSIDNGTTWNNIANTTGAQTYNNLSVSTQYRVLVQSGVCSSVYSNIILISVLQAVSAANAGADQILCSSTSAALNAGTPTSGTGTWTNLAGNPTVASFTNANDPKSTVSNLATGTYQFLWTVSNGVCTDSKDTVQITINPQTQAGTLSAAATVCATANSGTLSLTGYTGNIIRWESSTDNGTTWNNIANTTNSLTYNNLSATTQYRVLAQSGVCAGIYSNIITITVLQAVSAANAGADQILCSSTSGSLNAGTPISGTGTWTNLAGNPTTASFTNANDPKSTVTNLSTGTYQFLWTVSNGFCIDSKDTVQFTINPQTVAGTVSGAVTVCATANSGTLSLSGYTGNIIRWESSIDNGTTWNNIANTTNALSYNNLFTTTQYRVLVQSGVCAGIYSNIITITVLQPVSAANAGADQILCNSTSATMNAGSPTSGTGTWTNLTGNPTTASFTNANDPKSTVTNLSTGTYQFLWTVSNGICIDSKDTVQVMINPQTVPGTLSAGATVCATANTGILSLTGYTGTIVRWESTTNNGVTWNTIANTTASFTYNNLSATTQYRALVQSGGCAGIYSNIITITVLQAVSAANAGMDQALCNVTAATMSAATPGSGTGNWTAATGNPTSVSFANPSSPSSTVNGLSAGVYQFIWTVSNGICTSSKDTVQVTVYPATTPGTLSADATVCATSNSGTLSLTGYVSNIVQWESSTDNGSSWNTIANNTNSLTYNNVITTTQYKALVKNAVCPALYSNIVTVNVLQAVTAAYAGIDTTVINGITSYKLGANTPSSGTGVWSIIPGGPSTLTLVNPTDPKTTVTGLTFNAGSPPTDGIYHLVWTISNGYCAISRDTMQITVQPPTDPGEVGPDAVVCTGINSGSVTLTGYLGTILQWEFSTDYGGSWSVISRTVGTDQDTLNYVNLSTTTLFRALVKNGVGVSLYSGIAATITVLQQVTPAYAGSDQVLCNTTTTIMAGNTPTSGTGKWTAVTGNPSTVTFSNTTDPKTVITGLFYGSYQFVWTISNGICSDSRDTVTVTVQQPTVAGTIAADATVCATSNNGSLLISGFTGSIVDTEVSTDNGTSWSAIAGTANQTTYTYNNLANTSLYRAKVQNSVCPALVTNIVTITVLPAVSIANAGTDQQLCNVSSATLAANLPTSGSGAWTAAAANPSSVSFTNAADPNTTVTGLVNGTYFFIWTVSNGICADSKDTVQIVINPPTVPGTLTADATVCATANSGTLSLSGYVSTVVRWESSLDNGSSWNTISNTSNAYTYNNLSASTQYRAYVQNAVCPAQYSNAVSIHVVQAVTIANAGPDQQLCSITNATLAGNTPASGTGKWTAVPSNPSSVSFTNNVDPNTTVNGLTSGTYLFVWTISNALCTDSKDTVQIVVNPPTVPGTLTADATVCATANSGTLSLSGYVSSIVRWESSLDNGSSWNNIANTTNSYTYNNLNASVQYRAFVQNGVCTAQYSNAVSIHVVQAVTTANAGTDQQLCNVTTATLAGNTPGSGTGKWTALLSNPTTVIFSNALDPNTTVNGLTSGTYRFIWTISNALCTDSKDTVQLVINPPTVPGTLTADATVCATANSGTLSLSGYVSTVVRWESSLDNGSSWITISNTSNAYAYNNLSASIQYRAFVQNGVCPAQYSNAVSIRVVQAVTIANAGTDQQLCNAGTATLAGNTPGSGTGKWTALPSNPSTASFSNASDPNTIVNGLSSGTYRFVWTISNALCTDSKDTVQITVYPPTAAGTLTADAFVCISGNGGTVSLGGYTGNIIQWEYSTDNGVSWSILNLTAATYHYTNLTATTRYRVLVKSGLCYGVYSNIVTIHVDPVSVGGNLSPAQQTVCSGSNTGSLQMHDFTGTIMQWESSVDNGRTWSVLKHTDSVYNYTSITATVWYRVLIESGVCSSVYSNIAVVTVSAPTVAGTAYGDAIVCNTDNTGNIILKGRTGDIIHWESSDDHGNTWTVIPVISDTLPYLNLSISTQYRALVKNGACSMQYSNAIGITVVDRVTVANAGTDLVLCNSNSTLRLEANTPQSGSGNWSFVSGPSAVYFTNPASASTTVTGLQTGTYQFVWTISNGICSNSTDTVMVRVDKVSSEFNLSSINDCGKTTYRFYNTSQSAFGIKDYKWFNNGDTLTSKDISLSFTTEGLRDISLSVVSNTGCIQTTQARYAVIVYEYPKANINAIAEACKSQMLQVSSEINSQDAIASMLWNLGNGIRRNDSIITVQYSSDGKYTIKLTVATINRCYDSVYKQIMIHALPALTINTSPTICKGDTVVLAASGAMSYIWTDNQNNVLCNGCGSARVKPLTNQQYKVIGYNEYGCSQTQTAQIRVVQPFKMLSVKGDSLCAGQSRQLFASGASSYTWYPETGLSNKNASSPIASPQTSTTYHVIGKDDFNCFTDTAEVRIAVGRSTPINIGKDTVLSAGTVYKLNATGQTQEIRKWTWSSQEELSCRNCASPTVKVTNDATISCLAINLYGCTSTDTISIKTFCPATEIFIPNAFTPDGDGINDLLIVQGKGVKMIKSFRIFNRWGEVVFEKTNFMPGDPAYGWDGKVRGKPASPDIFVYICEVICEKGLPTMFKGNVGILK